MPLRLSVLIPVVLSCLWLIGCYTLRVQLMEDARWLVLCEADPERWACRLRQGLGWLIHWRLLAWAALLAAVPAFVLGGRSGRWLARLGLLLALPALVLYSASLASFAAVLSGLRLVRRA